MKTGSVEIKDPMAKGDVVYDIPFQSILPTAGLKGKGHRSCLCRLYLEGRCGQGKKCKSYHVDRDLVARLRIERHVEMQENFITEVVVCDVIDSRLLVFAVRFPAVLRTKGLDEYKKSFSHGVITPRRLCTRFISGTCENRDCDMIHVKQTETRGCHLPPVIGFEERRESEALSVKGLKNLAGDLKGDYYPLHGSHSYAELKPNGMSEEKEGELRKMGNLFQEPDSTLLLVSGMGRQGPYGRVFHNEDKNYVVWVGEEDHLGIASMQRDKNMKETFGRFVVSYEEAQKVLRTEGSVIKVGSLMHFSEERSQTFRYKEKPLEERQKESERIRNKYQDRIPVICERHGQSDVPDIDKTKYLVPMDLNAGQFIYVVRKRIKVTPEQTLFFFINRMLLPTAALMQQLYNDFKDEDGFLYIKYSGESSFGGLEGIASLE